MFNTYLFEKIVFLEKRCPLMNAKNPHTFFLLVFIFFSSLSLAQDAKKYAHNALAEKVYLQTDNEVYTNNKTIWFKAVILNASTHNPDIVSGVLYVELIDAQKKIRDRKLIKIDKGVGDGFFDLDASYVQGKYLIRAYTEWNKNFGNDFIFEKYIQIFSTSDGVKLPEAIQNIRRVDTLMNMQRFRVDLYPKIIDNKHKNKLKVVVTEDDKKDTVLVKKDNKERYVLDYSISKASDQFEIAFITDNNLHYSKTFSPKENYLDIQFFPESGDLVDGLTSKVGFKAIGIDGKGKYVEGVILNEKGEVITTFQSNPIGMGSFILSNVDGATQYSAKLTSEKKDEESLIPLPKVIKRGHTLMVTSQKNNVNVIISFNYEKQGKVDLKVSCRGYDYLEKRIVLSNKTSIVSMEKAMLPEGVLVFTLLEENGRPIAERLYFNEREGERVVISAAMNKLNFQYVQREYMDIDIETKNSEGLSVPTNMSLLVLNKDLFGKIQNSRESILSYFLLSSDIRGHIEDPGAYFVKDSSLEIDDLMLTQGWRKYNYTKPIGKFNHKLETGLEVSGIINVKDSKGKKRETDLVLTTFDEERYIYVKTVTAPGSFNFQLAPTYGGYVEAIVKSNETFENNKNPYRISLSKRKPLPVSFDANSITIVKDSLINKVVTEQRDQKIKEDDYYFYGSGVTQLDEVILNGYKLTPERKKMRDKYGSPNTIIEGDAIKEKEEDWSYGLYSVLFFNFRDKVNVKRVNGVLIAETIKKGKYDPPTLIVVDGIPVVSHDQELIQRIPVDEVKSFEVIDGAKGFSRLFQQVFPEASPPYPATGSVISIYTKSGNGLHAALRSKKQLDINTIPVFSKHKIYYTPTHDIDNSSDYLNPDVRFPIYWNPQVISDTDGKASVSFYNSDNTGNFMIIIEGVSNTGQVGYKQLEYTVKSRDN